MTAPTDVIAVVVGRNEGARLERCLRSVLAATPRVVYVDSESRDGSPGAARALGAEVVELRGGRMTAARGRQAGLEHGLRLWPGTAFVHFIDGDCILDPAWLPAAIAYIEPRPKVAAVFGRRRETRTAESLWSRLIDLEWEMPAGPTSMHGGDVLHRVEALAQVGGWGTDLIAGEDPDLSFRLRDAGWEIHGLRAEMTGHDIAMTRFAQFWKRARRSGHAYAEVGWRHRRGAGRYFLTRRCVSILFYGAAAPLALAALAVPWPVAALVLAAVLYGRLALNLFRTARRQRADARTALAYAITTSLGKFASALGVVQFFLGRALGRRSTLIEYKGPEPARAGA